MDKKACGCPAVHVDAETLRMHFNDKRRQQFLNEQSYQTACKDLSNVIELLDSAPAGSGRNEAEGWLVSYRMAAQHIFDKLTLRYTAGEAIDPLRQELEHVLAGKHERYRYASEDGESRPALQASDSPKR
ncbi:hypothetical protein [Cupriavidus gilardii]|uniref:hypothetical protein n=1 Tax=Cupriavidus gilardii TaxID=82541 RepID=UPI00157286F5|nr:hypothetical protein [Cupriavidus gilardii]NSX06271.1 hypothetical protein [Cupriavidus gilardii]